MGAILAVWMLFAALLVGRSFLDPDQAARTAAKGYEQIVGRVSVYVVWALLTPLVFWLCSHAGAGSERVPLWRRIAMHVVAAVGISALMDAYSDFIYRYMLGMSFGRSPASTPWEALHGSMQDALTLGFIYELIIYLAILAVGFARAYYRRLQHRQMQTAELRAQLTEARIEALRMQVNPHFLFNTLNAISAFVDRDPKAARTMVARLSAMLRRTLTHDGQQEVSLDDELAMLNDYLDIMHIRFEDRLQVHMHVDPDARGARVPDLIMQPIVENAIKHGIAPRETPGCVRIEALRDGDCLVLRVQDDGPGLPNGEVPASDTGGIGLRNVRERMQQLYGTNQAMTLSPAPGGGLIVELRLPYRTASNGAAASLSSHPSKPLHA
jgi:two-component sensor histidine kinase